MPKDCSRTNEYDQIVREGRRFFHNFKHSSDLAAASLHKYLVETPENPVQRRRLSRIFPRALFTWNRVYLEIPYRPTDIQHLLYFEITGSHLVYTELLK